MQRKYFCKSLPNFSIHFSINVLEFGGKYTQEVELQLCKQFLSAEERTRVIIKLTIYQYLVTFSQSILSVRRASEIDQTNPRKLYTNVSLRLLPRQLHILFDDVGKNEILHWGQLYKYRMKSSYNNESLQFDGTTNETDPLNGERNQCGKDDVSEERVWNFSGQGHTCLHMQLLFLRIHNSFETR